MFKVNDKSAEHDPIALTQETDNDETDNSVEETAGSVDPAILATVATVGVVGVGVVVFEAALLPGMILGVAAAAAPKYLPRLGSALSSLFKSTVRGVYKVGRKTRKLMTEAQGQAREVVAELEDKDQARTSDTKNFDRPTS